MTNIEDTAVILLNIDQISFESSDFIIYDIKWIKDLNTSDTLYLVFNNLDAYIEKSAEDKYLIFASTDKNRRASRIYTEIRDEVKEEIKLISSDKVTKFSKDFMEIKIETNDDLPLGKIINIPVCVIIIRGVFEVFFNYYPQVLLHDCFYENEKI